MTTPTSWVIKRIDEIYDVLGGGTPSTKIASYWKGNIPWVTSADLLPTNQILPRKTITKEAIKNSAANLVPANSIIVATRVGLGKVGIAETNISYSQDCQGLVPLSPDFPFQKYATLALYVLSQSFIHQSRGTTINGVTKKQLKELQLPLPPLPEQHRIVAKIEELFSDLDAGIAALKQAKEQLKIYRQSVLKWAFEGKLTNKNVKKGELPEGWKWVKIADLLIDLKYGTAKKCRLEKHGQAVLRIPNIGDGVIDQSDLKYADFTKAEIEQYGLLENDILVIRSNGSVSLVGKTALASKKDVGFLYAGYLIRLRLKKDQCLPKFICIGLSIPRLRMQIEDLARSTSGVNNINSDEIRSLLIPLPALKEQSAIVSEIESRLSLSDNLEKTIDESLFKATALRQSILKRAFEGKLVPQDPNDEPGDKLLDRIKADKLIISSNSRNTKRK
jgi:type I restriction enzyme, S subunit